MTDEVVTVSWDGDDEVLVYEYRAVEGSTLVKVHGPFTISPAEISPLLPRSERVLESVATGGRTVSLIEQRQDSPRSA